MEACRGEKNALASAMDRNGHRLSLLLEFGHAFRTPLGCGCGGTCAIDGMRTGGDGAIGNRCHFGRLAGHRLGLGHVGIDQGTARSGPAGHMRRLHMEYRQHQRNIGIWQFRRDL